MIPPADPPPGGRADQAFGFDDPATGSHQRPTPVITLSGLIVAAVLGAAVTLIAWLAGAGQ